MLKCNTNEVEIPNSKIPNIKFQKWSISPGSHTAKSIMNSTIHILFATMTCLLVVSLKILSSQYYLSKKILKLLSKVD
jgi:hypothetical protein